MKNKQKTISKILTLLLFLCSAQQLEAQSTPPLIEKADSLFSIKQYTQSLELYQEILSKHNYSESMLLKMAFIQEGLGQLSQTLYYLNLYYIASNDEQALKKMETLAAKHHLQGYKSSESRQIQLLLRKNYNIITNGLISITILLLATLIYQKRKARRTIPIAISILALSAVLFAHINFSQDTHAGIVNNNATYLMSGPSAGSSVVGIIDAGHLLTILDNKDIWVHAKWLDQDVYLKKDQVLMVQL